MLESIVSLNWWLLILSLASSTILTPLMIKICHKFAIFDHPNVRSNHKKAVPIGGGVAVVCSVLWPLWLMTSHQPYLINLTLAILILASISFLDDLRSLSIKARIPFQIIAIYLLLSSLLVIPNHSYFILILGIGSFFFINFYNFMDGIDGSASVGAIHICVSVILIALLDPTISRDIVTIAILLLGASAGFMIFNWHPARIFLGDVGSTSIGLLSAWLLINLALHQHLAAAFIIPLYYMSDSGLTLTHRLFTGKKIWQAHSEHFFQKAVKNGHTHNVIVRKIILLNVFLMILSMWSMTEPIKAVIIGMATTFAFLYHLHKVKA